MSDILKSVHKTAKGLYESGAISETTMHKFDAA
jgi:putative transcriptional regulator